MANPKRRHGNARRKKRRAHDALTPLQLAECPNCKSPKRPHTICGECGYYNKDRKILAVKS